MPNVLSAKRAILKQGAGSGLMLAGALVMLSGLFVPACQALLWLRNGFWHPVEVRLLWTALGGPEPAFAWRGTQHIALAVLELPLSLGLAVAGFLVVWFGSTWTENKPIRTSTGRY